MKKQTSTYWMKVLRINEKLIKRALARNSNTPRVLELMTHRTVIKDCLIDQLQKELKEHSMKVVAGIVLVLGLTGCAKDTTVYETVKVVHSQPCTVSQPDIQPPMPTVIPDTKELQAEAFYSGCLASYSRHNERRAKKHKHINLERQEQVCEELTNEYKENL